MFYVRTFWGYVYNKNVKAVSWFSYLNHFAFLMVNLRTTSPHLKKIEVISKPPHLTSKKTRWFQNNRGCFFVFSKNFLEIRSKISHQNNSTIRNLQIDCTKSIDKSEINVRKCKLRAKRKLLKIAGYKSRLRLRIFLKIDCICAGNPQKQKKIHPCDGQCGIIVAASNGAPF